MFDNKFQVILADTESAKQIHYKLRCKIYCLDRSFESIEEYPDRMEIDEVDTRSEHFLIREIETQEWIGTFRVVLADHDKLPIEKYCDMDESIMENLPRASIVEVSRLGISKNFTQRSEGVDNIPSHLASVNNSHSAIRNLREVSNGICRALWQFSVKENIENVLFFITPALARILLGMKIPLQKAGLPCKHRGKRYPYIIQTELFKNSIKLITSKEDENFISRKGYYLYSEVYKKQGSDSNLVLPLA